MKRHLCAIMAADMVGYSRLMEADEAGTIARQKVHLAEAIRPAIARHNGRVVKLMGDGILLEFASVIDAVRCGVEIQRKMRKRENGIADEKRIRYRIGINLGDVFYEDEDVLGDAVNIAARLEEIADPGGICISGTVYDHLKSNIPVGYHPLGEVHVKNIQQPVRAYRVLLDGPARTPAPIRGALGALLPAAPVLAALAGLAILAGGWWWWSHEPRAVAPAPAAGAPPAATQGAVPDQRPSIAVLPFANLGGVAEEDYFSDGITEDLITDLSQVSGLFVIARNTVFTYKNRAVNVQQVGRELGVSYVVEGSVRRAGERLRINAQLIDTQSGGHVWAQRYDRDLTDVFALQDDVVQRIVKALAVTLNTDERNRLSRTEKVDPEAYDMLLRGLERLRRFTAETNLEAREYFERAIALDPGFARAQADLALTYALEAEQHWSGNQEQAGRIGLEIGLKARELDPDLAQVHFVLSNAYRALGRIAEATAAARRSVELDPNYADGIATLSINLSYGGQPQEALRLIQQATRLNPLKPFFYVWAEALAYYMMGDYARAQRTLEQVVQSNPAFSAGHRLLAATYVELGRQEDAEWEALELLLTAPGFNLAIEAATSPITDAEIRARYLDALRRAGLE